MLLTDSLAKANYFRNFCLKTKATCFTGTSSRLFSQYDCEPLLPHENGKLENKHNEVERSVKKI